MPDRQTVTSGTAFEEEFGYSRAVRKGDQVRVSGTAPIEEGSVVAPDDTEAQAHYVVEKIVDALEATGAGADDVVMTRIYVLDFDDWQAIAPAHREAFGEVKPACTLVEVASMPMAGARLEIEAEAIV